MADSTEHEPVLDKQKHIRYWLRCFKTLLPTHYESNDSNRMFFAFMILSSLDILGVLHPDPSSSTTASSSANITAQERTDAINWIYACQHPRGGFRAFPGTDFGGDHLSPESEAGRGLGSGSLHLDPQNIAGTSFALASLVVLRDDLSRVDRDKCAAWLRKLQAEDGSFAEVLGQDGRLEGKRDVRHGYFAVATRYVLMALGMEEGKEGIDVEGLVRSIYETQSYDGGIAGTPGCESHGGYAYCAVGALKLLGKLDEETVSNTNPKSRASPFVDQLVPNLVWRQIAYEPDESSDEDDDEEQSEQNNPHESADSTPEPTPREIDKLVDMRWVGFDGRCNKPADTCYTFWVGGTLAMLGLSDALIDPIPHRRFLLEQTEHRIGGYGKTPGDPPDVLHSFMGLLALSIMHEPGLEPVDATFAMTRKAREHLEGIKMRNLEGKKGGE